MKFLERLALVLFSIIMLCLSVISCLVIFDIVELKTIYNFLDDLITNQTACRIILGSCVVAVLLAIKALFFPTKINKRQEIKTGVLLENKDGRLLISRDTIESIVNNVVKEFPGVKEAITRIKLDEQNNVAVLVDVVVTKNVIIKELTLNMQNRIKEAIKKTSDLEVNEVNVRIKDIVTPEIEED